MFLIVLASTPSESWADYWPIGQLLRALVNNLLQNGMGLPVQDQNTFDPGSAVDSDHDLAAETIGGAHHRIGNARFGAGMPAIIDDVQ